MLWILLIPQTIANFIECDACKFFISEVHDHVYQNQDLYSTGQSIGDFFCETVAMFPSQVCSGIVKENLGPVLDSTIDKFLNPEYACYSLGACSTPIYKPENFTDWQNNIMKDKPKSAKPKVSSSSRFNILHLTDIHLDLDYKANSNPDCGLPLCCRDGEGSAGQWASYLCDIPVRTVEASFAQAASRQPDMVLWTGDVPPHNVWNQSDAYQLQYLNEGTRLVKKHFEGIPVYPVLGNHGCFPVDVYEFGKESWLTDTLAQIWADWLDDGAIETLRKFGYYSILHKNSNLRIISMNSQSCNSLNFRLIKNVTDPGEQIYWLNNELSRAERAGEQVYLIGHIPPGSGVLGDCFSEWAAHYNTLIDRYQNIIRGQFFGHTHDDHIIQNRGVYDNKPISTQFIAPSLTTYTNRNPSFRIYHADTETKYVTDWTQYRLNVNKANMDSSQLIEFDIAYSFKDYYKVQDLRPETIDTWIHSLNNTESEMLKYLANKSSGGSSAPKSCDESCRKNNSCEMLNGVYDDVYECQGIGVPLDIKLIRLLFGKWTYKIGEQFSQLSYQFVSVFQFDPTSDINAKAYFYWANI